MPAGEWMLVSHSKLRSPVVGILEGQMLERDLKTCWSSMEGCSSSHMGVLTYPEDQAT
jgi:hypothetical protein